MGMKRLIFLLLIAPVWPATAVHACMWDVDTVEMERQQFPGIHELIVGHFVRHSPEFYYWRMRNRQAQLTVFPDSLPLIDDLAVALDKLGHSEIALRYMEYADSLQPCRYETYANRGTFLIHAGRFAEGVAFIRTAIEINPEAHFGREVYQKLLVEYALSKMKDGQMPLPLAPVGDHRGVQYLRKAHTENFYGFVLAWHNEPHVRRGKKRLSTLPKPELEKAIKGISGMMRFGNFKSPVLLEALADLLLAKGSPRNSAKHLTVRALLRAADLATKPELKRAYRLKAANSLVASVNRQVTVQEDGRRIQRRMPIEWEDIQRDLDREVETARRFYTRLRADEAMWIRDQCDPEAEFRAQYYARPVPRVTARPLQVPENRVRSPFAGSKEGRHYQLWITPGPKPVAYDTCLTHQIDARLSVRLAAR